MGRKFGVSFSWKRATGISSLKGKVARSTGIPTTRSGRRKKVGRILGGFGLPLLRSPGPARYSTAKAEMPDFGVRYARPRRGFIGTIRAIFGLLVCVCGLLIGLFAGVGWFTSVDSFGKGLAIVLGVIAGLTFAVGVKLYR